MGNFDYYSPMSSPNIDTDLFSRNATAGIAAGKALPTQLTAGIHGAIEGLDHGLDFYGKAQDATIKQNQIDQLPVANQIQQNSADLGQTQTAIAQNQVEQLPVANQQQEENLKRSQLQNDILASKASINKDTEDLQLTQAKEELSTKADELRRKRELNEQKDSFNQKWQQTQDPWERRKLIDSGEFEGAFQGFPGLKRQSQGEIWDTYSKDEQDGIRFSEKVAGAQNAHRDNSAKYAEKLAASEHEVMGSSHVLQALDKSKLTLPELARAAVPVPHGMYVTDPATGKIQFDDATGELKTTPGFDPATAGSSVDYKVGKRIVASGVPQAEHNKLVHYKAAKDLNDGVYRDREVDNARAEYEGRKQARAQKAQDAAPSGGFYGDAKPARAAAPTADAGGVPFGPQPDPQQATAQPVSMGQAPAEGAPQAAAPVKPEASADDVMNQGFAPDTSSDIENAAGMKTSAVKPRPGLVRELKQIPLRTKAGSINVTNNPAAYKGVQVVLGINNDDFKEVKPQVSRILEYVEETPAGWFGARSTEQKSSFNEAKDRLTTYVAGREYDTNPAVAKAYTPEMVAQHNQAVEDFNMQVKQGGSAFARGGVHFSGLDISQMQRVTTPRELYVLKKRGFYDNLVTDIAKQYEESISIHKTQALKAGTRSSVLQAIGSKG